MCVVDAQDDESTTVYATGLERISESKKRTGRWFETQKETKPTPDDDAVQGLMMTAFASMNAREALGVA